MSQLCPGSCTPPCANKSSCANCGQEHKSIDRKCPIFKIRSEIATVMARENISFLDAKRMVPKDHVTGSHLQSQPQDNVYMTNSKDFTGSEKDLYSSKLKNPSLPSSNVVQFRNTGPPKKLSSLENFSEPLLIILSKIGRGILSARDQGNIISEIMKLISNYNNNPNAVKKPEIKT